MVTILSVKELLQMKLVIPEYQRPYKWQIRNIEDLLSDIEKSISDFHTKENKEYDVNKILDQRKFLIFRFLDLNRTIEEQQNCLKGKIDEVFKSEVPNTQAALETILHCLTISSTTYNKNKQFIS